MGKLIVMRGCPGSGKSTAAREIYENAVGDGFTAVICSADNYFMVPVDPQDPNSPREYRWNPDQIGNAHRDCRRRVEHAMRNGVDFVIVDNTNTKAKEAYPYVELAVCYDYEVQFVEPQTPWWHRVRPLLKGNKRERDIKPLCKVFADRNTHGVGEHTILKMLMRFEDTMTVESVLNGGE